MHECWVCDAILRPPNVQIWSTRPVQRQMRSLRSRGAHAMQMHGAWVGSLGRGQGSPNPSRCPRDPGRRAICVEQAHREGGFLGVLRGRHASFWLKFPVEPLLGLIRTVHPRLVGPLPSHANYLPGTRRLPHSSTTSGLRPAGFTG